MVYFLLKTVFGSRLYGTSVKESDEDIRRVHIPDRESILTQRTKNVIKFEGDDESYALHFFLEKIVEGQSFAFDMLFSPQILCSSPEWDELVANRHRLVHRNLAAFANYCRAQAVKYGVKGSRLNAITQTLDCVKDDDNNVKLATVVRRILDLKIPHVSWEPGFGSNGKSIFYLQVCDRKYAGTISLFHFRKSLREVQEAYGKRTRQSLTGQDWKAQYHALRISGQAIELLETGKITFPRPDAEYLIRVRSQEVPEQEVSEEIDRRIILVEKLLETSSLRETADIEFCHNFLVNAYHKHVVG